MMHSVRYTILHNTAFWLRKYISVASVQGTVGVL